MNASRSRIRQATASDAPGLQPLLEALAGKPLDQETVRDRLRVVATSPIDELYVIEDAGGIQGLLAFRIRENIEECSRYGEISAVVTDPRARRLGYGRALMDFAEHLARQHGCKGTWLVSGFGREAEAHQFYEALGYQKTGYRFVKGIH